MRIPTLLLIGLLAVLADRRLGQNPVLYDLRDDMVFPAGAQKEVVAPLSKRAPTAEEDPNWEGTGRAKWVVKLDPDLDPAEVAREHGHVLAGQVGDITGYYLFEGEPSKPHDPAKIKWAERQRPERVYKRDLPHPLDPR